MKTDKTVLKVPTIVTILMNKGGVGKTTTTANIFGALARPREGEFPDYKIAAVDLDSQINLSTTLGVQEIADTESEELYTIVDLLAPINKEASVSDFLYEIPRPFFEGRGFLLPGHIDLASFGSDLEYDFRARSPLPEKDGLMRYDVDAFERRKASFFSNLRARFKRDLAGVVDFVIIDTPPSREFLTQIALGIADYVVPVLSPGTKELDGLEDMERLMAQAWISYNPDLRIPGVLLNEAYEREVLTKHIKDELFERYKGHKLTLETIVPRSVRIAEATSNDITIFESDHPEAQRYQDVYRSVVRELNSRALNLSGTKVFSPEFFYDLHFNDSTELKEFIEEEREVANG